jgi:hypothetical protein
MAGRNPIKASQRGRVRPLIPYSAPAVRTREAGEAVRWKDRSGVYRRDVGDGENSEIAVADRVYRVKTSELS